MLSTPEVKQTTERLRCLLSDEEKLSAGRVLADATIALVELEEDKTQIISEFKAKTTAQEAMISSLSNKLRSGYEYRDVMCEIRFDQPEVGKKKLVRMDTHEVIRIEQMTEEEKQRQLEL